MTDNTNQNENNTKNDRTNKLMKNYERLQKNMETYTNNAETAISKLENPEEISLEDWKKIIDKKEKYEDKVKDVKGNLENIYENIGTSWEDMKEMEGLDYLPTEKEVGELEEYVQKIKGKLENKVNEYQEDIDNFADIYEGYREISEAEWKIDKIQEEKGLSDEDMEEIHEKQKKIKKEEEEIKEMEKEKKRKELMKKRGEKAEDKDQLDRELNEISNGIKKKYNKLEESKNLAEKFPVTKDDIDKIYEKMKELNEKYDEYGEVLDVDEETKEKMDELSDFYKDFLGEREKLERAAKNHYNLTKKGYNDDQIKKFSEIMDKEDGSKYDEFKEKAGILSEKLDDTDIRREMIKAGRKSYDGEFIGKIGDYSELSLGSLVGFLEDLEGEDYDTIDKEWNKYLEQREEKDLPPITAALVGKAIDEKGNSEAAEHLISVEGVSAKVVDSNQLSHLYEMIDRLNEIDEEDGKWDRFKEYMNKIAPPGSNRHKAACVGFAAALPLAAGYGMAMHEEDTEFETSGRDVSFPFPTVVRSQERNSTMSGEMTSDPIVIRGNLTGDRTNEVELGLRDVEGSIGLEDQDGTLWINETKGEVESYPRNRTQLLNETDGTVQINETDGTLQITEGVLEGNYTQVIDDDLESEPFTVDGNIDGQVESEEEKEVSLLPFAMGLGALGWAYSKNKERLSKLIENTKDDHKEDKYEAIRYINHMSELSDEIDEAYLEDKRKMKDIMKEAWKDYDDMELD